MTAFSFAAPAKINLSLHITGRRGDGLHLLQSLVAFADIGDTLAMSPARMLTLKVQGPFADALAKGAPNLVMKAAALLRLRCGHEGGAEMTLTKNLPVAAGLGGGSSDAAAALLGLRRMWILECEDDMLHGIAKMLGSDVPVCLWREPAWLRGAGEQVFPLLRFPAVWAVLANPGVELPTAEVYRRFNGQFTSAGEMPREFADVESLVAMLQLQRNDLEIPARALLPVVGEVLDAVAGTSGCLLARMSGSGPTCFGLYADEEKARQAAEWLRQCHPAWWCETVRLGSGDGQAQ